MEFGLREGLSFCDAGPQLVFLDLPADRYFCLPPVGDAAFRVLINADTIVNEAACPLDLIERGILVAQDKPMAIAPSPIMPLDRSALELPPINAQPTFPRALADLFLVARALKRQPLTAVVASSWRAQEPVAQGRIIGLAQSFHKWGRFTGVEDQCLIRSIALRRALARKGITSTLTFAVKTGPFAAHCWLHRAGLLLTDRLETIAPFTPILSL